MSLNRKQMIRAIGQRTRLSNRQVALMLDALIEVWTDELTQPDGRIEIQSFLVLEARTVEQRASGGGQSRFRVVKLRVGKRLRARLQAADKTTARR